MIYLRLRVNRKRIEKEKKMSHWVTVKTTLDSMEALKKALDRMGLTYQEGDFTIKQGGESSKAEIKIDDAVGFSRQKDGTFAMVGDPYYSTSPKVKGYYRNNEKLNTDIKTAYALENAIMKMAEQQFRCIENQEGKIGPDGLIHVTFERL